MGIFQRFVNFFSGLFGNGMSSLENSNPAAVYEAAIAERIRRHKDLKKAVSSIVYLRNKTNEDLEAKEKELKEVAAQIPIAVEEGEDEVALVLLQRQEGLTTSIAGLKDELTKIETQAEEAKEALIQFQGEITKLQREKDEMLAKKATAEARIQIQESLSGFSVDADVQALENVRTSIHKLRAEADVGAEMGDASIDQKLKKIKEKAASATAQGQLDELKLQMAARKAQADASAIKKTM
jgi:phage shock protein A